MSSSAFSESIENARRLFDYAAEKHNCHMTLLDLGGGYPGSPDSVDLFASIAKEINKALDTYFPENKNSDCDDAKKVRIIAEPGRYYASSAFTLCLNVIAKRVMYEDNGAQTNMYYVNDGVYASFNCMFYDHTSEVMPILLKVKKKKKKKKIFFFFKPEIFLTL
jgi:ornithine decarboxylase